MKWKGKTNYSKTVKVKYVPVLWEKKRNAMKIDIHMSGIRKEIFISLWGTGIAI